MSVNSPLINSAMTAVERDQFIRLNIDSAMIAEDVQYMETKWWDYRTLHPLQATQHFIRTFYACAAPVLTREVSRAAGNSAQFMSSTQDIRLMSRMHIRGWWRARMAADAMGITYEAYCTAAIRNFRDNMTIISTTKIRKHGKAKQELPWPTQLYNAFILKAAMTQWDYDREKEFVLPESEIICHNPDIWFRTDMEAYLKTQIITRAAGNSVRAQQIARELVNRGLLLPNNPSV